MLGREPDPAMLASIDFHQRLVHETHGRFQPDAEDEIRIHAHLYAGVEGAVPRHDVPADDNGLHVDSRPGSHTEKRRNTVFQPERRRVATPRHLEGRFPEVRAVDESGVREAGTGIAVQTQTSELELQLLGHPAIVGIVEADPVAADEPQAGIERRALALVLLPNVA
jgi:hypothetical protein